MQSSPRKMSVCTKKSISLQQETLENLHETVDAVVKVRNTTWRCFLTDGLGLCSIQDSYTFLAKFDNLTSQLQPIQELAMQM